MKGSLTSAMSDLRSGFERRQVWLALASEDITDQHKRTTLGPFWLVINYMAFAGTFIFVFRHGAASSENYPVFVATGLLVWFFIMEVITTSVTLFTREENFIKGTTLPLSTYVMRDATQASIRAGYGLVGCFLILFLSGTVPSLFWLWSLLGLLIVLSAAPAVIILCAFAGAFFPDSQYLVANAMRVGMFVTPVFWDESSGMNRIQSAFYHYNPLTYFLDVVRAPIAAGEVSVRAICLCIVATTVLWIAALLVLGKYRRQVALII